MKKVLFICIPIIVVISVIVVVIFTNQEKGVNISFEQNKVESIYEKLQLDSNVYLLNNYNSYLNLKSKYELKMELNESDFINNSYLVLFDFNACDSESEVSKVLYDEESSRLNIHYNVHSTCGFCQNHYDVYVIKIDKINDASIKNHYKRVKGENCDPDISYKPIIYLYPDKDMNVSIKLENEDSIITSYPKYNNGWNIYVNKDGMITLNDRNYYALYWDEYNNNSVDFSEGFYVTKDNAIKFLEEKLDIIGLNYKEANEFIMYWLPILESNHKSLVYFELTDERQNNNRLIINPEPDSVLRINMHIKKINKKIDIKEQELSTFNRIGFSVVEWGGTIHKEG